jgi:hypothetical protein
MSAVAMPARVGATSARSAARARAWLRAAAVVLALFALGHTLGTASPQVTRGAQEALVFAAMKGFHFPVMGFTRNYWDFYRGFAITISVLQLALAVVAWQTASLAGRDPRAALPLAWTVLGAGVGLTIVSVEFFFGAPIVMAAVASACAAVGVWRARSGG